MEAVIILAHGSRADEANACVHDIVRMVDSRGEFDVVEPAFMGHCQPDLESAVKKVVQRGIDKVVLMPLFLYRGIHVQEDIPEDIKRLQAKYGIEMAFANHLGADQRIADIVVDRIREVG